MQMQQNTRKARDATLESNVRVDVWILEMQKRDAGYKRK